MTVLAHAGHWLLQLLYAAPVIVLVVAVAWARLREWRARRRGDHSAGIPGLPARGHEKDH